MFKLLVVALLAYVAMGTQTVTFMKSFLAANVSSNKKHKQNSKQTNWTNKKTKMTKIKNKTKSAHLTMVTQQMAVALMKLQWESKEFREISVRQVALAVPAQLMFSSFLSFFFQCMFRTWFYMRLFA